MKIQSLLLILPLLGIQTNEASAERPAVQINPQRIDAITDSDHLFIHIEAVAAQVDIHIFNLDMPATLEVHLSKGLPNNPTEAAQLAQQRLQSIGKQALITRFTNAYGGLLKALEYDIDRYPAVVFDHGESVVYGITDLKEALNYYHNWRRQRDAQ